MIAAAPGPTPLWYATRGSGYAALVLLSATVILGLVTSVRWHSPRWPRFLSQALHRNLSLVVVVFVVIHVAASIIDPFAGLNIKDAVVPFAADYRPLWLGLGVVSLELLVAIVVTSLLRRHLSWRVWQVVHLLAYISWPVAVLHTIGTGTDTKSAWALLLNVVCVAAVVVALVWRLSVGWPRLAILRTAGIGLSLASVVALTAWTASGPLQAGWAKAAGTPANLLASGQSTASGSAPVASPTPSAAIPVGLDDQLRGSAQRTPTAVTASLTDQTTPDLTLTIIVTADGPATLTLSRSNRPLCTTTAHISSVVTATCNGVNVQVQVNQAEDGTLTGVLVTNAGGQ
ncbi:MAG: ferric reductase-like transmembrane domain-containing protein [Candidatus Dormibacteraeota bacterium]|nr:ferric reductase-like transmembrane domain-containing protein [Candidatus Dormibacteraeota bacterium]